MNFRELGIPFESGEAGGMVERFHLYLIEDYKKDNAVVLFIDETLNVPVETLENIRMLSNLESFEHKRASATRTQPCGHPTRIPRMRG